MTELPEPIRLAVDALNRRDLGAMRMLMSDDIVWVEDLRYPGAETYHGPAGVERSLAKWFETWTELRIEQLEATGSGDTWVLGNRVVARAAESEAPVTAISFAVYELRDGLIARVRLFGERAEALAEAGLQD